MQSISEELVLLSRPHQGPGVLVHSEVTGGFVTLSAIRACNLDDANQAEANLAQGGADGGENNNDNGKCRITIGHRKIAMYINLSDAKTLISNVWVNAGEEVWMSTSRPNHHAVYGFVQNQRHGVPVVLAS